MKWWTLAATVAMIVFFASVAPTTTQAQCASGDCVAIANAKTTPIVRLTIKAAVVAPAKMVRAVVKLPAKGVRAVGKRIAARPRMRNLRNVRILPRNRCCRN